MYVLNIIYPTRQRNVLIMSPRRLYTTSYFIPLLGLNESLPDVILVVASPFISDIKRMYVKNIRKDHTYDVMNWSVRGRHCSGRNFYCTDIFI